MRFTLALALMVGSNSAGPLAAQSLVQSESARAIPNRSVSTAGMAASGARDQEIKRTPNVGIFTHLLPAASSSRSAFQGSDLIGSWNSVRSEAGLSYSALFESRSQHASSWGFNYDLDSFGGFVSDGEGQGFGLKHINVYSDGLSSPLYAGTLVQDGLGSAWVINADTDALSGRLTSLGDAGFRIVDIEFDSISNLFSAVWTQDNLGWSWALNYDSAGIIRQLADHEAAGFRPVDMEVYSLDGGITFRYGVVWAQEAQLPSWAWALNQPWTSFEQILVQRRDEGLRLIDFEVVQVGSEQLFTGAWVGDGSAGGWHLNNRDRTSFTTAIESMSANNLRPSDFAIVGVATVSNTGREKVESSRRFRINDLYPNPAEDLVSVGFSGRTGMVGGEVVDVLGRTVLGLENHMHVGGEGVLTFRVLHLPPGSYFVRLRNGSAVSTRALVISRR
jgi:Secretion system C-terminal sorting domain/Polyglycine hydrolase-like, structural repeat